MHLECENIHFSYPGTDTLLFQDLNLSISEPGFHALFGPSGVGKSSLARIITGHLAADKGAVRTNGQNHPLYGYNLERLPGWSSIGHHLERVTLDHNRAIKEELVQAFGLASLLNQRFAQLSLGQQNRINLLRYLVQDFQVLIMDESLANVDEKMRGRILITIKDLFPHCLFIYISHNVVEVATFCRQIWVMRGVHKNPQVLMVRGQDRCRHRDVDREALQKTMLEIMNAA
jgi:ABC-type nitrate/sulfonate/bicarbonate transport system ATPase subunit